MIRIVYRVEEFLDRTPMVNCDVEASVIVAPLFETVIFEPDDDIPGTDKPVVVVLPDFGLSEEISDQSVTGPDGTAAFTFNVSAAFQRAKDQIRDGKGAVGAIAIDEIRLSSFSQLIHRLRPFESDNESIERLILLDFAKSIVGHTTPTTTTLWFCLHRDINPGDSVIVEIDRIDASETDAPMQSHPIVFNKKEANTAILKITALEPQTRYRFAMRYKTGDQIGQPRQGNIVSSGEFKTFSDEQKAEQLNLAFVSCHSPVDHAIIHQPVEASRESLLSWEQLRSLKGRYDMLFLMGDQIYGDNVEKSFPRDTWFDRYAKRYHQFWDYHPMRDVFRACPTYMILDDHDVVDDFGTIPIDPDRVSAALRAYRIFQQSHNPGGSTGPNHYHFRNGKTAIFVLDTRTRRNPDRANVQFPILGRDQFADLQNWAASNEAQSADVIILVSSVPLAWIPVAEIKRALEDAGEESGPVVGALAGFVFGGLGGAVTLGALGALGGALGGDEVGEEVFEYEQNDPDLEDQWTFGPNQSDLVRVLDLLFDLANDNNPITGARRPNPRKRAVFVLGGDVHMGAVHLIRSNHDGRQGTRDHRANPVIYGLTSSPISHVPVESKFYIKFMEHLSDRLDFDVTDFFGSFDINLSENFPIDISFDTEEFIDNVTKGRPSKFVLDTESDPPKYATEAMATVLTRNFGLMSLQRINPSDRKYRFAFSIEGQDSRITDEFILNLDATTVRPMPVLKVRKLASKCLHLSGAISLRRDIFGIRNLPSPRSLKSELLFIKENLCS